MKITIHSELPVGMGLGSSAAYSVSLVAGLWNIFGYLKGIENKEMINNWAFQAECIMHGTPSGIDNTVSTFG